MSEETETPKIDWSYVTDLKEVEEKITDADQLQDGAKEPKNKVFKNLLETYAETRADERLGIMFMKDGVDECKDAQVQDQRRKLISAQLQKIAQTCSIEPIEDEEEKGTFSPSIFELLLKGFEDAEGDDKRQSLALIKAGVDACENADEQVAKRDLITVFEEEHCPKQEEPVMAEPEIVAPVKVTLPATMSAEDTKAISALFSGLAARLDKQYALTRSQAAQIRDQAGVIATQANRITALESGRQEDKATFQAALDANIEGAARPILPLDEEIEKLKTAVETLNRGKAIGGFNRRPTS